MNTSIKIKDLDKLVVKASKELKLVKVFHNDVNYEKTKTYLNNQKFLSTTNLLKIIDIKNFNEYPIGYIMINSKNEIVGFMGTFFSDRLINNNKVLFCNIHSWIVDLNYRLYSFFLISNLINTNINLTAYTPVESLKGLLEKVGFIKTVINFGVYLNSSIINFKSQNYNFIDEKSIIIKHLDNDNQKLFKTFENNIYKKILLINKKNEKKIFIIGTYIKKKGFKFFNLFYISKKVDFINDWNYIKNILSFNLKVRFFSEYYKDESVSLNLQSLISKKIKKEIFVKTNCSLSFHEFLNSDLIIS